MSCTYDSTNLPIEARVLKEGIGGSLVILLQQHSQCGGMFLLGDSWRYLFLLEQTRINCGGIDVHVRQSDWRLGFAWLFV